MVLSLFVNMCNPRVFGDNAYDPDVNASELWIDKRDINGKTCLNFTDNGNGLVQEKLHKMLSFGNCEKVAVGNHQPIGHYGNGFKSGSMRLGKDAIVFSRRMDVMSSVGIDKSDIPDLAKGLKNNANSAPSSLLDALEQHYQSLEGKKGVTTPVSGSNLYIPAPVGFAAAINTISSNTPTSNVSEEERQRILDEENARLQQLKKEQLGKSTADSPNQEQRMKELGQSPQPNPSATNPFATQTPNGTSVFFASPTKSAAPQKASDDLLSFSGNPFVQNVQNVMAMQNATQAMSQPNSFAQWNSAPATSVPASSSMFTSDVDFEKVFPNQSSNTSAGLLTDATGLLVPQTSEKPAFPGPPMPTSPALHQRSLTPTMNESAPGRLSPALISSDQSGFDAFGEVLKPTSNVGMNSATQEKLINKDLDSSLSQLAGNLNIKGSASQVKKQQHDWQPKGEQKKTGGQS
ncbi:phosphatidylinositol-binding clathrin assembly protein-like [Crassostrea angulata]|uniref:phosphatidylinositol-binding clathrin assembly protein-like n=1 Tax=Magallana angulata TaxID=2784310 RepID=UPI0022B0FB7E|nr:phosphatidylinositol-binding clathrin assembly protein-like [Crassostrea angulata]XP_052707660.1 phosphatidylinositol-binding clathrin assembly protein-like [Crassostrea angulata]